MNIFSPRPGDAVRITVDKPGVPAGSIAVLEGRVRDLEPKDVAEICFNFRAYRDQHHDNPEYVQAGGGPSWKIAIRDLAPTNETREMRFWHFKDGIPGSGRGITYALAVPVWEYTPTEEGRQAVQDWFEADLKRSAA